MITVNITTEGDVSIPIFTRTRVLGVSISGVWTGTIELQRKAAENQTMPPEAGDLDFNIYGSYTENAELSLSDIAPGWYRFKATAAMTGTAVCKLWL